MNQSLRADRMVAVVAVPAKQVVPPDSPNSDRVKAFLLDSDTQRRAMAPATPGRRRGRSEVSARTGIGLFRSAGRL